VSAAVVEALRESGQIGNFAILGVENVGPQMGSELREKGIWAVVLSLLGMLAYIWIRFELRFGIGALMASIHDVLIALGLFAWFGYEFNLTTIAAFLTLIGYSVNDTVVIFDRVRENMHKHPAKPMVEVMNESLNQTLARTVMTSGTTLLAVGALFVLGGDVLRGFAFVLVVGVLVGTYSSIYIASAFALLWEQLFGSKGARRRSSSPAKPAGTRAPSPSRRAG
jgi:preprotein translocase subunit SecF